MSRQIAVVGAGISGLAAAKKLAELGYSVSVIEMETFPGGRISSCEIEGCILDDGAQYFKPESSTLLDLMLNELDTSELIKIDKTVNLINNAHQILPPDPDYSAETRYSYLNGNSTLPSLITEYLKARGVNFLFGTTVSCIQHSEGLFELLDMQISSIIKADGVVVSIPLPQAANLLSASAIHLPASMDVLDRVKTLRQIEYRQCLTVMLGYPFMVPMLNYYALLAEDKSYSLLWLAIETMKSSHRAPEGVTTMLAQMGPRFSKYSFLESDELVVGRTLLELEPMFGYTFNKPMWASVKRWRDSQPMGYVRFAEANPEEILPEVVVCGDGLIKGGGKVHLAWESGIEAANTISTRI